MAYRKVQRADKGFDFFDDNGKKITIEQYTQATGANGSDLRKELARSGDKQSQNIVKTPLGRLLGNLGDFSRTIGAGIQQSAGSLADVAIQGGGVLTDIGIKTNPFTSQQKKNQQTANFERTLANNGGAEALRNTLQSQKDIEGNQIIGTSDVDESATRIATGRADVRDVLNVAGKSAQIGLDASSLLNPVALARGAGAKEVLRTAGRDALFYGGTQGLATGTQTLGQTGDLGEALKKGGQAALLSGVTQGALDVALPAVRAITKGGAKAVRENNPRALAEQDPRVTGYDDQYTQLAQQFDNLSDPVARREVSKAMAQNRVERLNTQKTIARKMGEGGYAKIPGNNTPDKFGTVEEAYEAKYGYKPDSSDTGQLEAMNPQGYQELLNSVDPSLRKTAVSSAPVVDERQVANRYMADMLENAQKTSSTKPNMTTQAQSQVITTRTGKFAGESVPNSMNVSEDLSQRVRESAPEYDPTTNKQTVDSSEAFIKGNSTEDATADVFRRLDEPNVDRQTVSDAIALAQDYDLKGGDSNLRVATELFDKLSEKLTKAGQTVQAASLINRRTPEGLLFDAQRQLTNASVDLKKNPTLRNEIKKIADSTANLSGEQKQIAIANLQKAVNKAIPNELVDKIVGTWKAGLLTGIRTTTGGALSNALFRGLREVSRPGAVATDMFVSLFTKKRSSALTGKGAWSGTGEGLKKARDYLASGVDERAFSADGKYIDREINFGNSPAGKAMSTYVNGVFRVMGAADRPFYYSQFKNSLAEATIVEAKNLKLKGKAFDDYVENGLKKPSENATQYATEVAEQSVLANDTLLSNGINGVRQSVERLQNPVVRSGAKLTLGVIAPFTKVPSAFLSRVIDFTPIGAVKEAIMQAGKKQLNQAKLVQAISEAGTGSAMILLGAELANNGLLTGNYPNDPKEAARWKAEGVIPNAIRVGDKYYSLNYAGPVGALFNVGKAITDSIKNGASGVDSLIAGGTQLATGTLEQSFLSGISGALDAIQDPTRYAANFVKSQAGSVIPTLLNDIGNATDETQRQANNAGEAILSRIPGARTTLNAKSDAFGNELKQANDSPIGRLVDPLRPSNAIENDLTNELKRLKDNNQFIYPLTDKTIKVGNETIKLDSNQQKEYNDAIGQETQFIWNNIINSEEYNALSDEDKKQTLANAQTDISAIAKKQYLEKLARQDAADKVSYTRRQEAYANGTVDPTLWIPSDNVASSSPTKRTTTAGTSKARTTTARKSSGTRRVGFKAPTSGGFKRTQSTSALRKLLADAGKKLG